MIEEFKKLEIIIGEITQVEDHPQADRLYVVTVNIGTELKKVVAGIKKYYPKEELVGKQVVVLNNLAPAQIRGVDSNGMILCASSDTVVTLLSPLVRVPVGTKVK